MAAKPKSATPDSDIPAKSKNSKKQPAPQPEEDEDEDELDEEDEEYTVEKVITHAFDEPTGVLLYEVKWENYEESTWEPVENLEGLLELKAYHRRIGGPPQFKEKATPVKGNGGANNKKRKLEEAPAPALMTKSKGGRRKTNDNSSNSTPKPTEAATAGSPGSHVPPKGTWENDVVAIQTITQNKDDGKIKVWVHWRSGARSVHDSKVVNQKCPQKMLEFYEAHLRFMPEPPPKEVMDANGDKIAMATGAPPKDFGDSPKTVVKKPPQPKLEEDEEEDEEDEDIGVQDFTSGTVKDVAMTG